MAKQKINAEKLENLLNNLKIIETTTLDTLSSIRDKYLKLAETEIWTGPKSEAFCESLKGYWNVSADFVGPVSDSYRGPMLENLNVEFESLNNFINTALGKVTNTDEETAKTLTQEEVIEKLQGIMASGLTTMKTATSALNMAMGNTGSASKVKEPTTQAAEPTTQAPQTTQPSTVAPEPTTKKPLDAAPPKAETQKESSTNSSVPTASASNGTPREVSVGAFYPEENNSENTQVAALNYEIIDKNGEPARDNIGKETIGINGKDYQVYTYDDPETPEKEHYIIGALLEDGERSKPTGNVYTIDYGNGDVYEFVDLDTNYTQKKGSEKTPGAAMDTYVDILSVAGQAYNNVGIESREPVKIADTGKTVSKK